jgi:hypothetical protein
MAQPCWYYSWQKPVLVLFMAEAVETAAGRRSEASVKGNGPKKGVSVVVKQH